MTDFRFVKPAMPRRLIHAVGYGLVAAIGLTGFGLMSGAESRKSRISEMSALIDRAEAMETDGSADAGLGDDAFYVGDTPQLAQAALQTNLQELAEVHKIDIEVIRAEQIEQIDDFVRLNLTLNGVAPEAELGSFLHGLASLKPLVVIEELSLRRARATRSNTERRVAFQTQLYGVSQR